MSAPYIPEPQKTPTSPSSQFTNKTYLNCNSEETFMPRGKGNQKKLSQETTDTKKPKADQHNQQGEQSSSETNKSKHYKPQAKEFEETNDDDQCKETSITMTELHQIIKEQAGKLYQEMNADNAKALEELQTRFKEYQENQQRLVDNLRHEIATKDARLEQLEFKLDTLEQEKLKNTVRIVNLPEIDEDKDIKDNLAGIAKNNLKIDNIYKSDIVETHRMGKQKNDKPRDLIVTFASNETRNSFRNKSQEAKLKTENETPVYVNDNLTLSRSKLFYDCRKWRKTKVIHSTWTQLGNVMIKMTDASTPVAVYNHKELRQLIQNRVSTGQEEYEISDEEDSDKMHLSDYSN